AEHGRGHAGQAGQALAAPAQQPATPGQVRAGVAARVAPGNVAQRQFEQVLQVVHGYVPSTAAGLSRSRRRAAAFAVWLLTVPSEQFISSAVSPTLRSSQCRSTTAARIPGGKAPSAARISLPPRPSGKASGGAGN